MSEKYLTVKDLQELYSLKSDQTVRRWVRSGMPCIRFGAQILRFREADVQAWLIDNKVIDKHPLSQS